MIAIVDYGVGNLRSVYKSFETVAGPLGIQVDIIDHPVDFSRWSALVLPGQGAFGDSINNLRRQGFESPLLDSVAAGLPLLGICVGMQMLFDESEEMGVHEGLHLIPGRVRRFPDKMPDPNRSGRSLRIPQMAGTSCIDSVPTRCWQASPMAPTATLPTATSATPPSRMPFLLSPTTALTTRRLSAIEMPGVSNAIRRRAIRLACISCVISFRPWKASLPTEANDPDPNLCKRLSHYMNCAIWLSADILGKSVVGMVRTRLDY